MILECPNCSTRYMMSSASIGEEGRTVRCAKCMHEWFQEPEVALIEDIYKDEIDDVSQEDETEEIDVEDRLKDIASQLMNDDDDDDDYDDDNGLEEEEDQDQDDQHDENEDHKLEQERSEDIPEGVKPKPREESQTGAEKSNVKSIKPKKDVPLTAKLMGYAASLIIFAVMFTSALIFKNTIVQAWPPSMAIYELAGFETRFKGQELIMETLQADAIPQEDGTETLVMKGRVVNLTDKIQDVPSMIAVLRDMEGKPGASWLIDAPVDQVEAGASFVFKSEYEGLPSGTGAVNLTFAPEIYD